MPELQNRASSAWWFFLLFPKGEQGYGPRQLVFTIAARAGDRIRINDLDMQGIDLNRQVVDGEDAFDAAALGWYCDGETVHHDYPDIAAPTTMSFRDGVIQTGEIDDLGPARGMLFRKSSERTLGMEAIIQNDLGQTRFEAWGDLDCHATSPDNSMNIDTPFGGTHYIGWRRMRFDGLFQLPDGPEQLEGIGFFQRVSLNVPVFPWKWIWAIMPDESMFSAYVPYIGRNLRRKRYEFFETTQQEQTALTISQSATWIGPGAAPPVTFNRVDVRPVLRPGLPPAFTVAAHNVQGDELSFTADSYGHSRYTIDRPILGGRFQSHWDYNEYMFRMANLDGRINGQAINQATMGQGFGNLEYTWGLGL